jgi:hypothetical protein
MVKVYELRKKDHKELVQELEKFKVKNDDIYSTSLCRQNSQKQRLGRLQPLRKLKLPKSE